ncbi:MAG: glutamate synthase-related protein, partial [Anaerolineae bacterium]|nr:glutamate synthase-related protein [Anaerolineae bacterium]
MKNGHARKNGYQRYHIEGQPAPDIERWPSRFKVDVKKSGLAKLLLKEIVHYRGNQEVILSRPCMYGVFSGPVGGFSPREQLCVGCLRCTTEFPDFVTVRPNPERQQLGDAFFHFRHVDAITYESQTGQVPVKGAGYRGRFGGQGWDGMWTDMSEIVRPTRDGIHGREFISTQVDIGYKPDFLVFDGEGQPSGDVPNTFSVPIPILFDAPVFPKVSAITAKAAAEIDTLALIPVNDMLAQKLAGPQIVPVLGPGDGGLIPEIKMSFTPRMVEMESWSSQLFEEIKVDLPSSLICLRTPFVAAEELLAYAEKGVQVFHLEADYHGRGRDGVFVLDLIQEAHKAFVDAGIRDRVTLIGSGGMIAAEHIPKAIICGLDAVALDTPVLVALQAKFEGECASRRDSRFKMPAK